MLKNKLLYFIFFGIVYFLQSNTNGVPQAVTKAPGESGLTCNVCHINSGNYIPLIKLDITDKDSQLVSSYIPGEVYNLKVKVMASNNPKAYGFQMVSLAENDNADMGDWSEPGDKVKQISLKVGGKFRKYLEQSGPKTNGEFTVKWRAPLTDKGNIDFYFAGLAANMTGNEFGDNHVTGSYRMNSPLTNTKEDINDLFKCSVYPNPSQEFIIIPNLEYSFVRITDLNGKEILMKEVNDNKIDICMLSKGVYIVSIKKLNGKDCYTGKFLKI